jgi:hypothetical protein
MTDQAKEHALEALGSLTRLIAEATPRRPPTAETVTLYLALLDRLSSPASKELRDAVLEIERHLSALSTHIAFGERARPVD